MTFAKWWRDKVRRFPVDVTNEQEILLEEAYEAGFAEGLVEAKELDSLNCGCMRGAS